MWPRLWKDHEIFTDDSPVILVLAIKSSSRNSKGFTRSDGVKWQWYRKKSQFSANKSPNQKRCNIEPKNLLLMTNKKSHKLIRPFGWCQNQRRWMTLNGSYALLQKRWLCCLLAFENNFVQESLADAKVSARQHVRVWRPLTKKSTANQRYAISYWWLIVTVATLLTICEIFSCVDYENRHFRPLYSDCRPLAEERPTIST